MNESHKNIDYRATVESLGETLVGVGTTWAAHGLKVGKMALEASATTLGKTAQLLETLADEFEKKSSSGPSEEAASTDSAGNSQK